MELSRNRVTTSVRTEGGLLPPDILAKIAAAEPDVPGLSDADFGLATGERFREGITRSWNRLVGAWSALEAVRIGAEPADPLTTPTRERFLLPLFEELGFGRLATARAIEIEGTTYPISHGWNDRVPVHLVGFGVELDARTKGVRGAAGAAPHALVQEYLNRSDEALWGLVANGRTLRLLRDSTSLTRQAFVEFDLEAIFTGELYADFAMLWTVCHRTRLEGMRPSDCLLEQWAQKAADDGTRALEKLRGGVEKSIATLGSAFLAHPANRDLREALRTGALDRQDYYRELLRLVYRLIFLFAAEDRRDDATGRELLLDPAAPEDAVDRYRRYYSSARLRSLAGRRRGTRHADLWVGFRRVVAALGSGGAQTLGLPELGSFLFGPDACPHLDGADLRNEDLLGAVRALATIEEDRRLRLVDYRNLGAEELGGVYEGLLELHPRVELDANPPRFALGTVAGNERKATGSYYTPTSLITALLDSALDPVVDEAIAGKTGEAAERAVLAITVVDPAAGSGHFLIAAAHRLAKRLAAIRSGEGEPPPALIRVALRDVIGRCIYAVDANPMAVELCKVSLWLEALDPGRPLSFLDTHVKAGNSLLGTTLELVAGGIPDAAYEPIDGDDRTIARAWRTRNGHERHGQQALFEAPVAIRTDTLAAEFQSLDALPEDSAAAVRAKSSRYAAYETSREYRRSKEAMDAWCTAFVATKVAGAPEVTTGTVLALAGDLGRIDDATRDCIAAASSQFGFFHWQLEFPVVFERGGFDVVLGNPPWEHTELKEKEYFAERHPVIAEARTGADRKRLIEKLAQTDPDLHRSFGAERRRHDATGHFLGNSARFPKCGRGRINLYAVFAEAMRATVGPNGRFGAVLPTGIATDDTTKFYFQDVVATRSLVSLFDFENKGIFPSVHSSYKFCLFTAGSGARPITDNAEFVFFAHAVEDLADPERRFPLSPEDIELLNPNTRTCPIFRSRADAELTKAIYRRVPVLIREASDGRPDENRWGIRFKQGLFNMTSDSGLFRTGEVLEAAGWRPDGNVFRRDNEAYLPLYEAKMLHQFDHRWATYDGLETRELTPAEKRDPHHVAVPRYWVGEPEVRQALDGVGWDRHWLLGFRNVARSTDERTAIAALLPYSGVGHSAPLLFPAMDAVSIARLVGLLSAFVSDFVVRQKLGGLNFTFGYFGQIAVPSPRGAESIDDATQTPGWVIRRVVELTYTAVDLEPFARECGWFGPPFRWDDERRSLIRAELDAAFFHLFLPSTPDGGWQLARISTGAVREESDHELDALRAYWPTPRSAAEHILDSFPIVRRKDEDTRGEYRTKRVILELYDAMQEATRNGIMYETRLSPPPGDPRATHTRDPGEPIGEWREQVGATAPLSTASARGDDWTSEATVAASEVLLGSRVRHPSFGPGTVLSVEARGRSRELLIRFDRDGEKWIALGLGLLEFQQ